MIPLLSRFASTALAGSLLIVWPFAGGCAHSGRNAALRGSPVLLNEDAPQDRGGANPNAPYMVAATPQLARRHVASTADVKPCQSKDLTVTEIAASVNGKYRGVKIAFDNDGLLPCRIGGYPSVSLLDQSGTPVANLAIDRVTLSTLSAQLQQGPVRTAAVSKPDAEISIAPRDEAWLKSAGPLAPAAPSYRASTSPPPAQARASP